MSVNGSPAFEIALAQAARRLAEPDRTAFLDRACAGDMALRARLDAMLAAHEQQDDILGTQPDADGLHDDPSARQSRPTLKIEFSDAPDEAVGQTLGRYKLLEKVGEGGCGVAYVAEQTEPVRRRVALKVIKLGMDTKAVVARFEAEWTHGHEKGPAERLCAQSGGT